MKKFAKWRKRNSAAVKLSVFTVVMLMILGGLVVVFSDYRSRDTHDYRAVFQDVSGLEKGDRVRIAGVEVGQVFGVGFGDGANVDVDFNVDTRSQLSTVTRAQVRYENLTGDRYLELLRGTGEGEKLAPGGTIPVENTKSALDLDLLLGGFKPLFAALSPDQVNELSGSLIQVFQGQGATINSLLATTASLTETLADRDKLIGDVVTNLNTVLTTISERETQFDTTLDNLQVLISGLGGQSEAIGDALTHLNAASGTVGSLLQANRPQIRGTIHELRRTATQLDLGKDEMERVIQRLPSDFKKMTRLGVYGGFFNFYLCGVFVKVTGPDGEPTYIPQYEQTVGRCAP